MTKSKINGILYNECLLLRPSVGAYGWILLCYWVLAFFELYSLEVAVALGQMVVILSPLVLFAGQESTGYQNYIKLFPDGDRLAVLGRYLFSLLLVASSTTVWLVLLVLWEWVKGESMLSAVLSLLFSTVIGLIFLQISLPLLFGLGVKRAKPWFFLLVLTPVALLSLGLSHVRLWMEGILQSQGVTLTLAILILTLAVAMAGLMPSYRLSYHILTASSRKNRQGKKKKTATFDF